MKVEDLDYDVIVFSNPSYESALVGVSHDNRAVYDYDKMVSCLIHDDGMTEEEAEDFINYNTIGSLRGDGEYPIVVFFDRN